MISSAATSKIEISKETCLLPRGKISSPILPIIVITCHHLTLYHTIPRLNEARPNKDMFNPFPDKSWFLRVCSTSLLKTPRGKEKLLVTSNFSVFHGVFYPYRELSAIFIKFEIVVCKVFRFGRV